MSVANILIEVKKERERQDELWGEQNHQPPTWYAILGEEVGEVGKAVCEMQFVDTKVSEAGAYRRHRENYREELIQVAAVAVAMIESLDRRQERDYVGPN